MAEQIVRHGGREVCRLNFDRDNEELAYFTFGGLEMTGIVDHFFATRRGGVSGGHLGTLNFSCSQGDTKENVDENFRRYASPFSGTPVIFWPPCALCPLCKF